MAAIDILRDNLEAGLNFLRDEIRKELHDQGHRASGRLIDEIDILIGRKTADVMSGKILMEDYYRFVNEKTRPHWPPFKAIYDWAGFVKPGLSERDRKSFA